MPTMTPQIERVTYTTKTRTRADRDGGSSRTTDGRLDVRLSPAGSPGNGTNPAQLFAAGWSACLLTTMQHLAARSGIEMPRDAAIDAEVDVGIADGGFVLQARMDVRLPGMAAEVADRLVRDAERDCPFSKATRGNVHVAYRCNGRSAAPMTI